MTAAATFGELAGNVPPLGHTADLPSLGGEAVKWARAIDAWSDSMRAANYRPRTIELRRWQLRLLAEAHLRRSPWSVKTQDLVGWLQGQDWSPQTLKSYRGALSSFYNWAESAGHVKRSPARKLPPVSVPRGEPRPAPEAVFEAALEQADDRTRLILLLAGYAGLRRAEIAGLRWDHIETAPPVYKSGGTASPARAGLFDQQSTTAQGWMRIVGKGGHIRLVPIHSVVGAELELERSRREGGALGTGWRYTSHHGSPFVFPGRNGSHVTPDAIGRAAARALGGYYTGHTLRHRFAGRAYAHTHDLRAVQQLLGHASPTTTAIYAKADREALRNAVDAI
jgi:integrase